MKNHCIFRPALVITAWLTALADAHPGNHATAQAESGLSHFLTSPYHAGPVIATLLLLAIFRTRRSAFRRRN